MADTLLEQLTINALSVTAFNGLVEAASGETVFGKFGKFRENLRDYLNPSCQLSFDI